MQITVKLYFQDEIRRVSIGDEDGDLTISHLKSTVDAIFPALKHGDFRLLWKDEDGDFVTISSNSEFLDAVKQMTVGGLAKFHIKAIKEPAASQTHREDHCATPSSVVEPVHDGVQCDECGVLPVVGARFKCSVRNDFDLCAACEAKGPQPHPMIKMNAPKRSFSPFRGFPGFGGRAGRGGGRFGGRGGGRFGGWGFSGRDSVDQPPTPTLEKEPQGPFQGAPPDPFHQGPFGGRGRGGEWREALRRRMQRGDPQQTSQDWASPFPTAATAATASTGGPAVHLEVGCDECKVCPIVGTRYKCAVREDYDLCTDCEARRCADGGLARRDLYPMLKIDRPEQAPGTFVYIFNKRTVHGGYGGRGHIHHGHGLHGHGHQGRGHRGCHPSDRVFSAVHRHVNCDQCGAQPITGPRFKCAVRPDFDLCSACAATVPQPFPMVKIYHPQHRPSTIVYAAALTASAAKATGAILTQPQVSGVNQDVHQGVRCDECKVCPIVGARFQCTGRDDYDLCGDCEALKSHQPFPMVKIIDCSQCPKDLVYEVKGGKPIVTRALTHPVVQNGIRCDECHKSPILGPRYKCAVRDDFDLCTDCEAKRAQPFPMVKIYDPQHHPSKLVFAFYDRLASARTTPAASSAAAAAPFAVPHVAHVPTVAPPTPTLPRPSLRFVRDCTLPDGTPVQPGQTGLVKIWDVRNDGLHAWPAGSTLVFCGGDVLLSGPPASVAVQPVSLLQPGEEGQLSVALTAVPEQDGRYVSYFRMQTAEGHNFGQRLWADITVTSAVIAATGTAAKSAASSSAAPSTELSSFIQGMDEHMKAHTSAHTSAHISAHSGERSPFIQGMDEHIKELQRLEGLTRQAQEREDCHLAEELDQMQLQKLHGDSGVGDEQGEDNEEEDLFQQVMDVMAKAELLCQDQREQRPEKVEDVVSAPVSVTEEVQTPSHSPSSVSGTSGAKEEKEDCKVGEQTATPEEEASLLLLQVPIVEGKEAGPVVDCVSALAASSPVPTDTGTDRNKELELAEGWAVLVAAPASAALGGAGDNGEGDKEECEYLLGIEEESDDCDDCGSEYSAGVHQPASVSSSALLPTSASALSHKDPSHSNSSTNMSASYANACADLDYDLDQDQDDHSSHHGHHDAQQLEYMDGATATTTAAVESKEPELADVAATPYPTIPVELVDPSVASPYHKELQMLAEMGFTDVSVLVPLLQKHVRGSAEGGGVDAQGLHAVLAELLN